LKLIYVFYSIFFFWGCSNSKTQSPEERFSADQVKQDLDYLYSNAKKAHPALFWYTSEDNFDQEVSRIKSSLKGNYSEVEHLQQIAKLNSLIKCAHSDIKPSKKLNQYLNERAQFIPINITKLSDGYVISENISGKPELDPGTQILSINGIKIADIVSHLLPYIPADGDNISRKFNAFQRGFYKYYWLYQAPYQVKYQIAYQSNTGQKAEIQVAGVLRSSFIAYRNQTPRQEPISLKMDTANQLAILTIHTFRNDLMEEARIDFETFIQTSFLRIKEQGIDKLIIDLRNNGGGYSEYGAILYEHLTDSTYRYCQRQSLTHNALLPEVKYDIPKTFDVFPKGITEEDGNFIWTHHSVLKERKRAKNAFDGKVYFLINGGCASTTSEFASIAHAHQRGVFIGEEVGGSYKGTSGAVLGWITLPHSKIRVRLGMVKYELAVDQNYSTQGVQANFPITPSIADFRSEIDPILAFAKERIIK